jgi:AraC family transcriptional regulator
MQNVSYPSVFDTAEFTLERPVVPYKQLFEYYPSEKVDELHYHNFFELGFCEYGSGVFIVDSEPIPYNGKTTFLVYSGQPHIAQSNAATKSKMHFLYIDLEKLFFGDDRLLLKGIRSMKINYYSIQSVIPFHQDPDLFEIARLILYEAAGAETGYLEVLKGLLYALFQKHSHYITARANPESDECYHTLLQELRPTLNFISQNYTNPITIQDLLDVSNFSKPTLQRKITAFTGYSPMQYIHSLRLNRAVSMIADGNAKILDIANEVGYPSLSCFNRQFKAKFDCSPSEWKRRYFQEEKEFEQ